MKFIATGDFGGNVEMVEKLLDINLKNYDFLVFTGDIIAMKELRKIGEATARGFKVDTQINYSDIKERLQRINEVFRELKIKIKVYGILGNSDLRKTFISLVPQLEFENIHNKIIKLKDYFLIGYEGRPKNVDEIEKPNEIEKAGIFPGRTYDERAQECNAWTEEKAYEDLSKILQNINPRKSILITHYPPNQILDKVDRNNIPWAIATFGEVAKNGNIGSLTFQKVSKNFRILLHVFSHVHESKGIEKIGATTYVNIGSLEENKDVCEIELKNEEVNIDSLEVDSDDSIENMFKNEQQANQNDVKELFHEGTVKARTDLSTRQIKLISKAFYLAQVTGQKSILALLNDFMTLSISKDRKSRQEFVQGLQARIENSMNQNNGNIRGQFGK